MAEPKTYKGGCHCGAVKYEVTTDLAQVMECNCSHCSIKGLLLTFVTPEHFRLLEGEGALSAYHFNRRAIDHLFCKHCGVESFARGKKRDGTPMVAINLRCVPEVDRSTLTVQPVDGKSF